MKRYINEKGFSFSLEDDAKPVKGVRLMTEGEISRKDKEVAEYNDAIQAENKAKQARKAAAIQKYPELAGLI